ncbi:MAG: hypothetical protein GF375_02650, partial [Candidatus Omnitrophica bacterium]|nr:hypothetical protein [Candidatus Omnitrophota bacterium]MBD3268997.1 hypothetical protein [Candidatus Omnitrophota bacterium]
FVSEFSEEFNKTFSDRQLVDEWSKIFALRNKVLKKLEEEREKGGIGSSLETEVRLKLKGGDFESLRGREEILKEIFITSAVSIEEGDFEIIIGKAKGSKCMRCWNWSETVGMDKNNPQICSKCSAALKEGSNEA